MRSRWGDLYLDTLLRHSQNLLKVEGNALTALHKFYEEDPAPLSIAVAIIACGEH